MLFGVTPVASSRADEVGAYVTAGPSFNDFEIDDGARSAYQASGSDLETVRAKVSFAFKPGSSATYGLSSWLALETWKLDQSTATLGVVAVSARLLSGRRYGYTDRHP